MCNNNSNNYNKDVQTHMYTRCNGKIFFEKGIKVFQNHMNQRQSKY